MISATFGVSCAIKEEKLKEKDYCGDDDEEEDICCRFTAVFPNREIFTLCNESLFDMQLDTIDSLLSSLYDDYDSMDEAPELETDEIEIATFPSGPYIYIEKIDDVGTIHNV